MAQTLTAGDVRWRLTPGVPADTLIGPEGLRLQQWLAEGLATLVKQRPHRSVWRVRLPGLDFYLKHDHAPGNSRLRNLVFGGAARREFERGLTAAARGVPTPEPLAFGERVSGVPGGYLLTRTLADSLPLDAFLQTTLPSLPLPRRTRLRQRIAVALGRLLATLHDAGLTHRDLHPGNLLVRWEEEDVPHLWLIDLHAARLGRPLGRAASVDNLVILNRWFILRSERTDRLRCWNAYRSARRHGAFSEGSLAAGVERDTLASNLRFWNNRDRRCLGTNRYFRRVSRGDVAGYSVADLPAEVVATLLADPDAPFSLPGARLLKSSGSSTVAEIDLPLPGGSRRVVYKRFAVTAWSDPWVSLVRPAAVLRSWVMGHGLLTRLLPTPRPLAMLQRFRNGLAREGYLLTERVPDAVDLGSYADRLTRLPAGKRQGVLRDLLGRIGRLLAVLHQRHLSHRDLKAPNLLLRLGADGLAVEEVFFIDLVGVRRHGKLRRRRRVQNLARLHASFHSHPGVTRTDKLRVLRAYLATRLRGRLGWKRWWQQIEAATAWKVRRNRLRSRPLH